MTKERIHLGYGKPPVPEKPKKPTDGEKPEEPKPPRPHVPVGVGYSGRCVEFRTLAPDEVTHIRDEIAKELAEDMRAFQFEDRIAIMGVEQMIVAVTPPVKPEQLPEAQWTKTTPETIHRDKHDLFTVKDLEILKAVYLRRHAVNPRELEDIMGGVVGSVD